MLEDAHAPDEAEREAIASCASGSATPTRTPTPRYAGQMLKPPAAIAWAAYATAMLLNPNNHALDGGPATAEMEKDAVAQIAAMFGLPQHLGHLTASGTIANLEALWVARELHPDRAIVSGANAHYTHARVSAVLGARHETVPEDAQGRLDLDALATRLRAGGVGTVVATPGTTALGAVDDVAAIADLCAEHGARLHVDAAYGGFFALLADGGEPGVAPAPFAAIARADSVVVDPHKHGLQPYGCGCVLFADPGVGRLYAHDSPYTYFTSDDLHLGEISLECSRAGASAAALWTTLRALPLTRAGLGRHVAAARAAALDRRRRARRRPAHHRGRAAAGGRHRLRHARRRARRRRERRGRARVRHARRGRLARGEAARGDRLAPRAPPRTSSRTPRRPPCCAAACSSRSTRRVAAELAAALAEHLDAAAQLDAAASGARRDRRRGSGRRRRAGSAAPSRTTARRRRARAGRRAAGR